MNRVVFSILLFFVFSISDAIACRCLRLSTCEFYNRASVIFLGKNLSKTSQGDLTFQVIEQFKGVKSKTIKVTLAGAFCGASASPQEIVLIYAMKDHRGRLYAHNCGYIWRDHLNEGHLKDLRERMRRESAFISGWVTDIRSLSSLQKTPPEVISQIKIRVSNGIEEYFLKLDDKLQFELTGLKPATYTVELLLPENCTSHGVTIQKVDIQDVRSCGLIDFSFSLKEEPPTKPNKNTNTNKP